MKPNSPDPQMSEEKISFPFAGQDAERPLAWASVGFLATNLHEPSWEGPSAIPARRTGGLSAFPRRLVRFVVNANPIRPVARVSRRFDREINLLSSDRISPAVLFLSLLVFQVNSYAQGNVEGRVVFEGTPPAVEKVEVKSDVPTCGTVKEISKLVLGENRGIANAVIKIIGAQGKPEAKKGNLDQVQCEFVPHVQVLPAGSSLVLTSSDSVLHNSHAFYEDGSTAFNIAVPIPGMEVSQKLDKPGVIKLRCDAGHTWMSAYISVVDTPYYALTDANGNFTIPGVPPGDYEIEVWHEWLGKHREPLHVGDQEQPVKLILKKLDDEGAR